MIPKIRVWDGERMIYNAGFTPEGIAYTIPKNAEDSDQYDYYPECPVMLSTGFKDKNGKEIYDGDILKSGTSYDKVFLNKSAWSTKVMKRYRERGGWVVGHVNVSFDVAAKYGGVIGNIYDNPELLK